MVTDAVPRQTWQEGAAWDSHSHSISGAWVFCESSDHRNRYAGNKVQRSEEACQDREQAVAPAWAVLAKPVAWVLRLHGTVAVI